MVTIMKELNAPKNIDRAVPSRIRVAGVMRMRSDMRTIMTAGIMAPRKAFTTVPALPVRLLTVMPITMEAIAPRQAPEDMPVL